MSKKVLVVAAHPDDEILGCGGTIVKHSAAGDCVHILIRAEGITSRNLTRNTDDSSTALVRLKEQAEKAAQILGAQKVSFGNFPDNRMDSLDRLDIIKVIELYASEFSPEIVYTHNSSDVNVDHQIINEAVVTAFRALTGASVKKILFFETLSSTEWQCLPNSVFWPNYFVDITGYVEIKCDALNVYSSELREWPHPRSCRGMEVLSSLRGCTVGVEAAEAFMVGRIID